MPDIPGNIQLMQQPIEQPITFKGKLHAGNAWAGLAILTITSSQITLRSFLVEYKFESQQIAALEQTDSGSVLIKHILTEYPSEIRFSPSIAASEVIAQISRIGFIPTASIEDVPIREGVPIRVLSLIPMVILVVFLLVMDNLLGWVKLHPHQFGKYSPLGMTALFAFSLSIRLIPAIQNFILRPGRHIGEIAPSLNLVLLVSGVLSVASILMLIGMPELLVLVLGFGLLRLIISRRLNYEADQL
ncbi:MAG: hypothetical protein SFY66_08165 [Oculatellaceae cyanobacterium bins.114]|nr:hypothetical protein [Oculatellaceae cyanobacterium bins.114]